MIILLAKYLYLISFLIVGLLFIKLSKSDKKKMLLFGSFSGILSLIFSRISSIFINNPRPFVVDHVIPLISHAPDNGFPSDHTLLAMWLAAVVFLFNKKIGVFLALISIIVGTARVLALVHHPLDIFGSIVIALISVAISFQILRKPLSR